MTSWKTERCSIADAPALADNNMSAFWEDPTWILLWPKEIILDYLISQCAKRYPRSLLNSRKNTRHLKAVDPITGELVGYARWILPDTHLVAEDGTPQWGEAQIPDVSEEEKIRFQALEESAWWSGRSDMDSIDDLNDEVMHRILVQRPYMKLDYLAVHPRNKGKGIATALVAAGVRAAESIGLPTFTMSYKAGRGVYARLGFEEVDRVIQDDSQYGGAGEYGAYFMIREIGN
ncbi:Acetyltransferase GNAT family protein [Aspergillus parasiticus SU-1]|uniref:Acetyltransferase GNAT family protein n=1 Tax=Aspergillus parasiticus (strain ATCC 56775 / NRRL 5862 / SRRC 143 / SU-1) TaxID=1403190 RepID=A0A0F0ILK5_ASPPU|nr:Acetyltransferase GNAT family protein [Aspergillus parasiticus SU-1]